MREKDEWEENRLGEKCREVEQINKRGRWVGGRRERGRRVEKRREGGKSDRGDKERNKWEDRNQTLDPVPSTRSLTLPKP